MQRELAYATSMSLVLALSACGGGGGDSPAPSPAPVAPAPPPAPVPPPPAPSPPPPAPTPAPPPPAPVPPPPPPAPPPPDTTPPTAPANTTAAAQSANSILVSWEASTDASGISGYRVFRNGAPAAVATVTTNSFTDTHLAANTAFTYTIAAVDGAPAPNVSALSAPASATTMTAPPVVLATQQVYSGLTLTAAHSILRRPHDATRWVVVQQDGRVLSFADEPGVTTTSDVLDIRDRVVFRNVHGLLGLVFHPDFPTDTRAWVAYTHETSPGVIVLRISEFVTADNGATLNPASEQIIFELAQPGGHNNGGHLLFGQDGFLYLGMGDGGNDDSATGVPGNGQLTNNLLGKILRLDVGGTTGTRRYRIPSDNPFAANALCNPDGTGTADCPEIFAWGFRNPWRWSFDRFDGQLWLADVGSHTREEIDRVVRGGNYGWRCMEGTFQTSLMCGTPTTPLLAPVAEYTHTDGQVVTGGFVYRGSAIPGLVGRYVFADFSSEIVWHIATDTAPTLRVTMADSWDSNLNIASFAEDANGELYLVDVRTSGIYKLVPGS